MAAYDPNWRQAALNAGKDVNSAEFSTQRAMEQSQPRSVSVGSSDDYIKKAIEQQKQAIQPAIQSYQASIPETQQKFATARTGLEAQRQPLTERYNNLIASIKGTGTQQVNQQTKITNSELAKRGLSADSTLTQQEIFNATDPLVSKYAGMEKDANLDMTDALRGLDTQISGLAGQETDAVRAINNAIAQLQAGAGQTGAQIGSSLYGSDLNAQLQRQQQEQAAAQAAIASALAQSQFDFTKSTDERNFSEQQRQFNAQQANKASADGGLGDLFKQLGIGGSTQASAKKVIGRAADGRYIWSDGTMGWTGGKA